MCLTRLVSLCRWTTWFGTCAVWSAQCAGRHYVSTAAATSKTKRSSVKWIISGRVSLWPCFQNTTSAPLPAQLSLPPSLSLVAHTCTHARLSFETYACGLPHIFLKSLFKNWKCVTKAFAYSEGLKDSQFCYGYPKNATFSAARPIKGKTLECCTLGKFP